MFRLSGLCHSRKSKRDIRSGLDLVDEIPDGSTISFVMNKKTVESFAKKARKTEPRRMKGLLKKASSFSSFFGFNTSFESLSRRKLFEPKRLVKRQEALNSGRSRTILKSGLPVLCDGCFTVPRKEIFPPNQSGSLVLKPRPVMGPSISSLSSLSSSSHGDYVDSVV